MIKKSLKPEDNVSDAKDALIKKTKAARIRWRKIARSKKLDSYTIQGKSDRSPKKILYFVEPGSWWKEMREEIKELETEIEEAGFVGRKKPRELWLPVMIEDAVEITVKIYQAKSVRPVSIGTAINFKSEARFGSKVRLGAINDKSSQYGIESLTGRNYQLRVTTPTSKPYYKFTDWVVCLCPNDKSIELYEENPEYTAKSDSKERLCSSKKDRSRILFRREDKIFR